MNRNKKILIICIIAIMIISGGVGYGISKHIKKIEREAIEKTKIAMQKEQQEKEKVEKEKIEKEKKQKEEEQKKKDEEAKKQQEIENVKQIEEEQARQQEEQQQVEESQELEQQEVSNQEADSKFNPKPYFPSDIEIESAILNSFSNYMRSNSEIIVEIAKKDKKITTSRSVEDLAIQFLNEVKSTEYYKEGKGQGILNYIYEQTPDFLLNNLLVDIPST
ncbi:hypothetical protein [Clostridium senegalense]|uniref:hypothetical protein n=1 Tax=Clostridium senegalense TaxID=1465809 RepID=UPI0002897CA4|nr:hypothetical protein [Clostridium senegalense]